MGIAEAGNDVMSGRLYSLLGMFRFPSQITASPTLLLLGGAGATGALLGLAALGTETRVGALHACPRKVGTYLAILTSDRHPDYIFG